MTPTDSHASLRAAQVADAATLAALQVASRAANTCSMPPMSPDPPSAERWMARRLDQGSEGWIAEVDGAPVGYVVLTASWLDDLYVAPGCEGGGIGTTLLRLAQGLRPDGFALWVFETNQGARRFYRRHGLVELERTDGAENDERAPDIRMAWPGRSPLTYLRDQIDDVDDQLADLLARRVALTGAVQPFKTRPGRDPERERSIAERLAGRVPALGADRLSRILDVIVSESLDATRD